MIMIDILRIICVHYFFLASQRLGDMQRGTNARGMQPSFFYLKSCLLNSSDGKNARSPRITGRLEEMAQQQNQPCKDVDNDETHFDEQ
jgi:hypothetical protein